MRFIVIFPVTALDCRRRCANPRAARCPRFAGRRRQVRLVYRPALPRTGINGVATHPGIRVVFPTASNPRPEPLRCTLVAAQRSHGEIGCAARERTQWTSAPRVFRLPRMGPETTRHAGPAYQFPDDLFNEDTDFQKEQGGQRQTPSSLGRSGRRWAIRGCRGDRYGVNERIFP